MPNEKPSFAERLYRLRARWEDRRMGGISVDARKPSRFAAQGAEATQSSDYRCLDRLFRREVPLTRDDVLLDVGCGEGRVLTYLRLHRCRAKLIGIELDPAVAETARQRTASCPDIEILAGDILQSPELLARVTVFYLFNPFNGKIFSKFVAALERTAVQPVRLVYLFDYYAGYLDGRPGWTQLAKSTLPRAGAEDAPYSVYRFDPKAR